jgi:hypothetical protein
MRMSQAYLWQMPDARYPFTPAVLMYAPATPGVYMLWDRDVLLFVGHARAPHTILGYLMDHYCGRRKPAAATHCGWELRELDRWLGRVGAVGVAEAQALPAYVEAD